MGKKWNILYVYSFGYKTLYATKEPSHRPKWNEKNYSSHNVGNISQRDI
jgi:hypothetical protein